MARKQKLFNYEFADGPQQIPSSYRAVCTKTGEIVPIYHKVLQKMVLMKYKNKFELFLKTFVKRGADDRVQVDENGNEIVDKYKLNAYSDYLVLSYKAAEQVDTTALDQKAQLKLLKEKAHIKDCFMRHFNRDIESFIQEQK